tara:strand:+ start:1402 stop:1533 length:132 start_codon:yes stop_codon:yes gene_type:complete
VAIKQIKGEHVGKKEKIEKKEKRHGEKKINEVAVLKKIGALQN